MELVPLGRRVTGRSTGFPSQSSHEAKPSGSSPSATFHTAMKPCGLATRPAAKSEGSLSGWRANDRWGLAIGSPARLKTRISIEEGPLTSGQATAKLPSAAASPSGQNWRNELRATLIGPQRG